MKLFSNTPIEAESTDFMKWETINGDALDLRNARPEYLECCMSTLLFYMDKYPCHINYQIWEEYLTQIEDLLALRDK